MADAVSEARSPGGREGLRAVLRHRWRCARRELAAFSQVAARLWPYARRRRGPLAVTGMLTIALMLVRLLEPWPLKLVLDHVLLDVPLPPALSFLTHWSGGDRLVLLAVLVGAIVALAMLSGLLYYQQSVRAAHLGQQVVAELRLDLYTHLHRLSFTFHDRRRTGDLIVRLVQDIQLLRDAVVKLPLELSENSLFVVGMGVVMLLMDWQLACLSLLLLPVLFLLVRRYRTPMKAAIKKQRHQEGDLASAASDALGAVRAVQGFVLEEHVVRRFGGANKRSLKHGMKAARLEAKLRWSSDVTVGLATAAVVGLGAHRILAGALSLGDLVVFVAYLKAFARPLRRVSRTTERMTRTSTAGERVLEILDREPDVRDLPGAVPAPALGGAIGFEHVSLRHGRHWVLRRVSLQVDAGERVGIVGPTGAGKSSLVSLVPRFYDPGEGRVTIDGHDVRSFTLSSLRRQIGLVFQEPILFATTVAENIAVGRPEATRAEIETAARRAGIHEFVEGLAEGYDTVLGERGGTLSGGERQCIAIARAILFDAPIAVLDEPTTGLDQRAAARVVAALQELMRGRTVLFISHELARLRDMDRIVVLERGTLVQQGTHEELAGREGLFRELASFGLLQ